MGERKHVLLFFKNFAYNFTFAHDMIVKYGHGVWAAINYGVCWILCNVGYAVARKTANSVLVDESGRSVIVIVVCRGQQRFEIADQIKWETELFLVGLKFEGAIFGIWIFHRLRRVTHTFWNMAI